MSQTGSGRAMGLSLHRVGPKSSKQCKGPARAHVLSCRANANFAKFSVLCCAGSSVVVRCCAFSKNLRPTTSWPCRIGLLSCWVGLGFGPARPTPSYDRLMSLPPPISIVSFKSCGHKTQPPFLSHYTTSLYGLIGR